MGSRAILSVFSDRKSGSNSPVPQAADCGAASYRFNPYDAANCKQQAEFVEPQPEPQQQQYYGAAAPAEQQHYNNDYGCDAAYTHHHAAPPAPTSDVLHKQLINACTFVPYPTESYPIPECTVPRESLARVFIGQLPYRVTPMQLAWLCDTVAPGVQLFHVETIMKKTGMKGKRLPTGCIHALARPEDVDYLINCLSYRVLFDDTGIWCAQTPEETEQLQSYCTAMKHNEQMRFRDRPYQPVVVQFATSQYGNGPSPRRCPTPPPAHHAAHATPSPSVSPSAAAYGQSSWDSYGYPQQQQMQAW